MFCWVTYREISNTWYILVGDKIADHSYVVGAAPYRIQHRNIYSGSGLISDGTKPSHDPMLTCRQQEHDAKFFDYQFLDNQNDRMMLYSIPK